MNTDFLGLTFAWLVVISDLRPLPEAWEVPDAKAIDMTPWKHAKVAAFVLFLIVLVIYIAFSDFGVLASI